MKLSRNKLTAVILVLLTVALCLAVKYRSEIRFFVARLPGIRQVVGKKTADDQATEFGAGARARLEPLFAKAGLSYPPDRIALLAFKQEAQLELYAANQGKGFKLIASYPILGASGHLGPKLREGDRQVPEGFYQASLEPNTPYHLALRLNYPNQFDVEHAKSENRNPGSDILIHGTTGSIGCLAMGDPASEDLFIAAYDAKSKDIPVLISPVDLRTQPMPAIDAAPPWLPALYEQLKEKTANFRH
jgi:hypothetical protein